jgi:predicted thioesterase
MQVEQGARGEARLVVQEGDTALALGSGDVPVLGTPRLIALCESATIAALTGCCGAAETTVGMRVQVDHMQPTRVGIEVVAEAVLEKIEGRRLTFTVSASDPAGLVAAGKVVRVIVERERFLDKAGVAL